MPAKTPPEIIGKINADTVAALADAAARKKLEEAGYNVVGSTAEELHVLLRSEIDKWTALIKAADLKQNE